MTNSKRQRYGFGSFVKKFTRPIKKIAKSKLGKAALLGGGLYGLGSLAGGTGGWSNFGALGKMFGKKKLLGQLIRDKATGDLSMGKLGLMGLLGAGAAMPFMGGDEEEEVVETPWENTPASIANITAMARARDPSLNFLPQNVYTQSGFYAADGGLAKLANGGVAEAQAEQMLKMQYQKYRNQGGTMSYQQFKMTVLKQAQGQGPMAQEHLQRAAQGGRIGYQRGGPPGGGDPGMRGTGQSYGSSYGPGRDTGWSPGVGGTQHIPTHRPTQPTPDRFTDGGIRDINPEINRPLTDNERYKQLINIKTNWGSFLPGGKPYRYNAAQPIDTNIYGDEYYTDTMEKVTPSTFDKYTSNLSGNPMTWLGVGMSGKGQPLSLRNTGEILSGHANTINEQAKLLGFDGAEGGRVGRAEGGIMDLGGMEKDYRQEGGFVPLGKEEKADDVPARLSKNEFVFTADAVKAAGGGDIDAGAEVMQNMMNNLEEGGEISEESQGAQGMYNQQQMLQSRMA